MDDQLFEDIYHSNYSTDTQKDSPLSNYLESPLEIDLKAPLYLNEIYFRCNVFPQIYEDSGEKTANQL